MMRTPRILRSFEGQRRGNAVGSRPLWVRMRSAAARAPLTHEGRACQALCRGRMDTAAPEPDYLGFN